MGAIVLLTVQTEGVGEGGFRLLVAAGEQVRFAFGGSVARGGLGDCGLGCESQE
jgi:hypothetical protein